VPDMYVHRRLAKLATYLDHHESSRSHPDHHTFEFPRDWMPSAAVTQTAKEFIEREPTYDDEPLQVSFRHSCWHLDRSRVHRALRASKVSPATVMRFVDCGSLAYVVREKSEKERFRVVGNYCKSRWCVPCARAKSFVLRDSLFERMHNRQLRFVTLTIKSHGQPLGAMVKHLYDSFAKLKRTDFWINKVAGGVAFLEVKRQASATRWHPHLHCIVEGKFLPQKVLSQLWRAITEDSHIVDVRLVKDQRSAANYVTKYCTKPMDNSVIKHEASLIEAINTLAGKRMMITFGTWRGIPLKPKTTPADYTPIARLDKVLERARQGHSWALTIYARLRRLPDCERPHEYVDPDDYDP